MYSTDGWTGGVINLRQTIARVLISPAERPSSLGFHRKRGVLSVVSGRIRRVWALYPRGSFSRADLRVRGEGCPTLPLDGFHRKRGVRVCRVRLNPQLEGLVYTLSSVLVTTAVISSPPGFARMDASLLSTPPSESFDSILCGVSPETWCACPGFCQLLPLSRVSGSKVGFHSDTPTTIHRKRGVSLRTTLFQHHQWALETLLSMCSFDLVSNQIHMLRLT
jgi:hypothetical protein